MATIKGKKRACSLKKDNKGWYVATHRARSKSYASPESIPEKDISFIESTAGSVLNGIEKLALNAQKAREMAKKVGLLPEGQWKWALRQLRGKSGKELSDAKKKLGSLPNSVKNSTEGASRKVGDVREVGTSYDMKKNIKAKNFSAGNDKGVDHETFKNKPDVHTHPDFNRNILKQQIKSGKETLKLEGIDHPALIELKKNLLSTQRELEELFTKPHTRLKPSPPDIKSMKENNIASIYSPREKIEGIHKLRPEGVRSIYLDRTPRKALEKKAFEIEYTKDKSYKGEHERVNLRDKDGSLAAYMTTRPDPAKRQNVTAISSLYVDPRYRGKGLAKKLLDIAKSKHSNLVLRAKPFKDKPLNTDALKGLYGKHGFMPASGITKKEKSSDDIMFYKKASRNILNKIAPRVQDMHGIVSSKKRKEKEKEKIYKKARAPRPKTYAVDFDGTIVDNAFPRIGKPKKKTIDFIKKVHSRGDRVVIWTSRGGKTLGYMQNFLDKHKVPYHEINTNSKFQTGSPKIVADYYIDDKAVHVDDLHKIAAIPGSVPRIMSGLINKKVMAAPPLKPKLSTIPRASVPGGTSIANKKIAKEDFVMNLMEKLAARGFKYKRNKDYESQTRGKRPRTEMNFRKPVIKTEAKGLIPFLKKNKRGAIIGAGLGLAAGTGAALYNRNKEASDFIDDEFEKIAGAKLEAAKGAMSKIKNFLNRDVKYLGKRVGKASEKESFPTTNPLKAKIKTDGVAKKVEKEVAKEAPVAKKVESFSAKSPKDLANEAKTNKPNQQKTYPTENVNKAKPKVEPQRAYSTVNPNKVKPEPPKAAIPKMETPKTEAPKAEAPKPEAPKTEAPKTEAPKAEAPGTEKSKSKLTWKGKLGLGAGVAATGAGLGYASGSNEDKAASDFIDEAFEKTSGTAWKKYLAKPKNLGIAERVKATKDMDIKKIPGIEYNMDEIARAKIKGDIASKRDRILNSMR